MVDTAVSAQFRCKKVIVSVPSPVIPRIKFDPPLPAAKQRLVESTNSGYWAKMILVFDRAWWRELGLSGRIMSMNGPFSMTRDTCVEEDEQYSITCFLLGDRGREWSKLNKIARRQAVLDQFKASFRGTVEWIPTPINIIEHEWTKYGNSGAPSPIMGPNVLTSDAGKALRASHQNVHFVGTETAYAWKGYMDGAISSGVRGAKEVITALAPARKQ